jgi:hypothetical protein
MNAWKNIAFTVDGKLLIPYENGVRQQAITLDDPLSAASPLGNMGRIGSSLFGGPQSNGQDLGGYISDYRIYGSVLSDRKMADLYFNAFGVKRNPKIPDVAWYKFDGDTLNYCVNNLGKIDATSGNAQYFPYLSKRCFYTVPGITANSDGSPKVPGLPAMGALTFSCYINITVFQINFFRK